MLLSSIIQERADEQRSMQQKPPALGENIIRKVHADLDIDGDFVINFENGSRRYSLVVVLRDHMKMGWKECQALADVMKISARGTEISNESFLKLCNDLDSKNASTNGPLVANGRLSFLVNPGPGSIKVQTGDVIAHMSISFDGDGDLVFEAKTYVGQYYNICISLPTKNRYFFVEDCKAFIDVLYYFETGDRVDLNGCLCALALLRKKYNFIRLGRDNTGKLRVVITPSRITNPEPLHPAMEAAVAKMKTQVASQSNAASAAGLPPCPYPGIRYTRALQKSGQAQVYAGVDKDGKKVAVKVFSGEADSAAETYRIELRMLLKMPEHRNVIEVLEFFETPEPALVTRLIEGVGDMSDYLSKNGRMEPAQVRQVGAELAEGIAHLHRSGIVHRDLKTANVLLQRSSSGRLSPVIIDLGLGKALNKRKTAAQTMDTLAATMAQVSLYQQTGSIKGTVPWMAPEMITKQEWSEKTDVFAFGIILWELLSAQTPYDHLSISSPFELLMKIASGERPDMTHVQHAESDLQRIIQRCWEADPKRRPGMQQVLDSLRGNDPVAIFNNLDKDNSKSLDFGEFVHFLQKYAPSVPPADMPGIFDAIDGDSSGGITLGEFLTFWRTVQNKGMKSAMTLIQRSRRAD